MKNTVVIALASIAALCVSFDPAIGQNAAPAVSIKAKDAFVDLSVPESPAFVALGVTPEEITRPESPRALAVGILSGADRSGNLQEGIAIDTAPFMLFRPDLTLQNYRGDGRWSIDRFLARTQVSLATTKGASDNDESIRAALGLRFVIFDFGDPRMDNGLTTCFRQVADGGRTVASPRVRELADQIADIQGRQQDGKISEEDANSQVAALKLKLDALTLSPAKIAQCRMNSKAKLWNASAASLGVAPTFFSQSGKSDDLELDSTATWASIAYGFEGSTLLEDRAQIVLGVRYKPDDQVPDPNNEGKFLSQDTFGVGMRLRFVGFGRSDPSQPPGTIIELEVDYVHADRKNGREDDAKLRYILSSDIKVPALDNSYIRLSAGTEGGDGLNGNKGFVIGNLKIGF
ncbi:MAG: hypothetical protein HQ495_09060 [Alphaproteobacteria bacterium]|nr:hypothetical protein [Alphaproteobacteria bacterium]